MLLSGSTQLIQCHEGPSCHGSDRQERSISADSSTRLNIPDSSLGVFTNDPQSCPCAFLPFSRQFFHNRAMSEHRYMPTLPSNRGVLVSISMPIRLAPRSPHYAVTLNGPSEPTTGS